jgi:hypothetical protein
MSTPEDPPVDLTTDVPVQNPEPGESIPPDQIPYPDWMIALDEPDPQFQVAFRLRGRQPDQAVTRNVASIDTATILARRYQALGWGGDVTITRLVDGVVMGTLDAPLTAPDAPI